LYLVGHRDAGDRRPTNVVVGDQEGVRHRGEHTDLVLTGALDEDDGVVGGEDALVA
jgi:hypothetical protein